MAQRDKGVSKRLAGLRGGEAGKEPAPPVPVAADISLSSRLQTLCDLLLALAAAIGIAALSLQYGFYRPPIAEEWLHRAEWGVLGLFLLNRLIGVAGAPSRRRFLQENWFDILVVLGSSAAALFFWDSSIRYQAVAVGNIYVIITLLYLLVGWGIQLALSRPSPGRAILIWAASTLCLLLLAMGLLLLPKAAPKDAGLNITSALFTASAAACNTGLIVRDLGNDLSLFGQLVVLVTMQFGALALLSLGGLALLLLGRRLAAAPSPLLELFPADQPRKILRLAAIYTFILEAAGAALLYPMFASYDPDAGTGVNIFRGIFHAVSAFTNTGFTLEAGNLQTLRYDWQVIGVIGPLVLLGGLGIPVIHELLRRLRHWNRPGAALSLHTKVVLVTLAAVIVLGAAILIWNEFYSYPGETFGAALCYQDNPYKSAGGQPLVKLHMDEQVREALFQVTARSTGFATTNLNALSDGGKLLMILYAFIGTCPAGLGGGIKLGIVAVLCVNLYQGIRPSTRSGRAEFVEAGPSTDSGRAELAEVRGRMAIRAFGSGLSWNLLRVAAAVVLAQVVLVLFDDLLVSMFMTGRRLAATGQCAGFLDLFMDANSACCNSGVSCGLTGNLSQWSLVALVGGMFVGHFLRLVVIALFLRQPKAEESPAKNQIVLL